MNRKRIDLIALFVCVLISFAVAQNDDDRFLVKIDKIDVEKDYSKNPNEELKCAEVEQENYLGDKCYKITANKNGEINACIFYNGINPQEYEAISYSIAGFDGDEGSYTIGLLYNRYVNNVYRESFYSSKIAKDQWTTVTLNLVTDERDEKVFGRYKDTYKIHLYSKTAKQIYIKDLKLIPIDKSVHSEVGFRHVDITEGRKAGPNLFYMDKYPETFFVKYVKDTDMYTFDVIDGSWKNRKYAISNVKASGNFNLISKLDGVMDQIGSQIISYIDQNGTMSGDTCVIEAKDIKSFLGTLRYEH